MSGSFLGGADLSWVIVPTSPPKVTRPLNVKEAAERLSWTIDQLKEAVEAGVIHANCYEWGCVRPGDKVPHHPDALTHSAQEPHPVDFGSLWFQPAAFDWLSSPLNPRQGGR